MVNLFGCGLSAASLNTLYGELPTVSTGGYFFGDFDPGYAGSTQSIASGKGWTME